MPGGPAAATPDPGGGSGGGRRPGGTSASYLQIDDGVDCERDILLPHHRHGQSNTLNLVVIRACQ